MLFTVLISVNSIEGKILRIFLIRKIKKNKCHGQNGEKKTKNKIHDFATKIHLTIIFSPISSPVNLFDFYSFRSEEKPVALLVYSSFRRVATSGIRNSSIATISVSLISVSRAQMRSEYGVTP